MCLERNASQVCQERTNLLQHFQDVSSRTVASNFDHPVDYVTIFKRLTLL